MLVFVGASHFRVRIGSLMMFDEFCCQFVPGSLGLWRKMLPSMARFQINAWYDYCWRTSCASWDVIMKHYYHEAYF